ncbi:hypothetical protein BJ944DRAFT_182465 [Cunninghamella echinulata]|nr:hypothetical protein BJ944DRAFT_182465 [Cunninghamella echinulata]
MTKDGRPSLVKTTAVQVALRIRPITDKDRTQPRFANLNDDDCLKVMDNSLRVIPHNKIFNFDHIFGPSSQQQEVFATIGENLIHKFIEGYNVTILAYGQTSSGKTYTMGTMQHNGRFDATEEGIVPRAMSLMFDVLQQQQHQQSHEKSSLFSSPPIPAPSTSTSSSIQQRPASPTSSVSSATTALSKGSRLRPRSRISKVPAPPPTPSRSTHYSQQTSSSLPQNKYTVKVSFVEIYNEELIDLLNDAPIEERPPIIIREDPKGQIYWTGVKEVVVNNAEDVLHYLEQGTQSRATGATDMNEKSSRSHAIFSVTLQQEKPISSSSVSVTRSESPSSMNMKRSSLKNLKQDDTEYIITSSKFHFVDLAGSERLKRTAAQGDRRKEGININAGLLALGNVISALGDTSKRGSHVPYRDSKLTRLLQDSLGGNATTLMIACVSPIEFNLSETLNTLHYANRARNIKNRSEKNEVEEWMTTENMELLRSIIAKLKNEVNLLKSATSTTSISPTTRNGLISISPNGFDDDEDDVDDNDHYDTEQLLQQQRLHIADLQHQIEELDGQATVTHERNKVVEAELQRLRKLDMLRQKKKEEDINFEHLVEPVIEEYEKSIAKLESELSVARAALHHSDFGIEDLQTKCDELQRIVEQQQETMSDLQSRVSKLSEREQSNAAYIEELEMKLEQSAMESKRDQDQLNDVRSKLLKWKEKEDNTENYIHDLERRLAISEENQLKLTQAIETLEQQRTEQSIMITKLKKQSNRNSDFSSSQQQLMLNEIDELTTKCKEIEKEKEDWKQKAQQQLNNEPLEKNNHSRESSFNSNDNDLHNNAFLQNENNDDDTTGKNQKRKSSHRRSLADEQQAAFLLSKAAELRAEEHQARAEKLEQQLKKLELEHKETINELNDMFQRYQETLNHVEHLENTSMLSSTQTPFPTSHSQPSISSSTTVSDDDNNTATTTTTTNTTTKEFMPPLPSTFSVVDNHHHHANTTHTSGLHLGQEMLRGQDQEHRNTIAKLEKQIDDLNDHVTRHRDSLEAVTLEKTQQADTFSDYIAELKNTIQRLETESEEANNKIRSLQHAADDHDDLVERTVFQLDELVEKNEDLLKQYATTKSALETLQQKHRSIIEEKSNLTHQLNQLQHQHEQALQLHQDELEMAKNQVKEHSDLSMQQVNELETECQSLRSKLEEQYQKEVALLQQVTQSQEALQKAEQTYQDKINQLVQSMDEERLNWKEQLGSKLKEKELAHQEQLEKEKADVFQQVESKWLSHETEWKQQIQQLETLLQEKDDHHQCQLKELKSSHLQAVATERTEVTNQLEATWLERETEWQHQIKQLETLMQEKEDQHQRQLKEMSDSHLSGLDSEKAEALHQLENTWLTRQSEWQHQLTQLQQESLEKEKQYKMDMEIMKREHHAQLEKEKEEVIKETEYTVSLKHTSEWEEKAKDIEKKWEEKTNSLNKTWQEQMDGLEKKIQDGHQSQIRELLDSHEREKKQQQLEKEQHIFGLAESHEKEKKDGLHQVESVWLARQSEWEQQKQISQRNFDQLKSQLAEKEKAYDLEHTSLMDMKLLLEKAQKEVEDAQADITEYESLLEEADKNIAELTTKLEQAMENEKMLEHVMDDAVKENEATAMKLKSLGEQYTLLLSKQQETEQDHEKKIKDVTRLEKLLEEKSQQCKKHEEEIAQLKADHYTVSLTSDQLLTTKNELEQDHIEKLKTMTLLEQQLEEKKKECHQQQKEIALLKTDLSTLKLNIDQHASTSADKEVILQQQIKAQVANAEQLSLEKQKEYDELHEKYKKATESLMELETKLASMAQQHKQDKEHYEKELDQLTLSHHQQLETELSALQKDITHAQAQVGNTKTLYEQLQKEHDELKSEYQQQLLSLQQEHERQLLLSKKEIEKDDEELILPEPPIIPHHLPSPSSPAIHKNDDDKEKQQLLDENEEYAELTKTLEQELDKVTQELNKLVIEANENEITIQEQLQKIQQLEKEKHQPSTDMNNISQALKNDNDILKQKVAELEQRCHQQEKEYLTQVQERDQQSAEQIDQMTHQQQQMQLAWDKDKQEKDKLTRQVKLLEEKMDLLLQDKKKFLCF